MDKDLSQRMRKIKRIHFVGIGGAGMGGIAEVLVNEGYQVSGSDIQENAVTQRLAQLGAKILIGHQASNIDGIDVLVKTTAVKNDNPELQAAIKKHIPIVPRAQMLGELMRFRQGIAVAGTHGKTTTTSLLTCLLSEAGLDPTFVIGGLLNSAGTNARLGTGEYLVAEADESDASFLFLQPMMTIVTNIDADHMDTYDGDFEKLRQTFLKFLSNLPFYGLAVLCIDDAVIRRSLQDISRPMLTYGFSDDADYHIVPDSVKFSGWDSRFTVKRKNLPELNVELHLPGKHNILNATAAIAIASEIGVADAAILKALHEFAGVGRRMQKHGDLPLIKGGSVLVMEDYGHHPRELEVTIDALRHAYPDRRLVMVFQPHRYTRTRDLLDDFAEALCKVDSLVVLDVYAAGEAPIVGADSQALCRAIRQRGQLEPVLIKEWHKIPAELPHLLQEQDILLLQGAGNVGSLAKQLMTGQL